jgi:predicted anti-sigma-YlaC factor YlaD
MDQGHIQGDSVVESYLNHQLTPEERTQFEAHLVDCEACRDRVLLAEMFHVRNGLVRQAVSTPTMPEVEVIFSNTPYRLPRVATLPKRARFVASLEPWQIWVILSAAALLLMLIPTGYFVLSGR